MADDSWDVEFAEFLEDIAPPPANRSPACATRSRRARGRPQRSIRSRAHDHHAKPAAHLARRRRHRPAVLLPRSRRVPDRRRHRQVRLHHGAPPFVPRHLPQVFEVEHVERVERDRSTRSSARRSRMHGHHRRRSIEITTLADIPAGTGWARRAASRPRCSRRSTPRSPAAAAPARAGRAGLRHRDRTPERARSASRTSTSPPTAGITCFDFKPDGTVEARPLKRRDRHAVQARGQPAAVLHRLLAQRERDPPGSRRRAPGKPTAR